MTKPLWDSGVGYLRRRSNLAKKAPRLETEFPQSTLQSQITDLNPDKWIKDEYHFAPFRCKLAPRDGLVLGGSK